MSDINPTPANNVKPGNGEDTVTPVNPHLEAAREALPAYIEAQQQRAELLNDLKLRVNRLEALLLAHGVDLEGD